MKQIIQNLKNGKTLLEEVPVPVVQPGHVLIKTTRSLISSGTEKMLVEFGKANLIQKARQQPDKVKMVLDKMKTDGVLPTLEAVFKKLEQPLPLGYCNTGHIIAVGKGVQDFKVGQRVASNGSHAEYVLVPKNLVARIPEQVSDDAAAFTVIGAIGLQGIRLIQPSMGETIVVIGLGLIGLLTAQMLMANGCRVIGYDLDDTKVEMAKNKGVIAFNPSLGTDPVKFVLEKTHHIGADGVIIAASAKTNDVIAQAAEMSRKRGRIVLVGVVGLQLSRALFYEKELSFQVSCSYGPGRYDNDYEHKGIDYPLPFVRWTEKRNFEAVLQLMASGKLDVKDMISEIIPLHEYQKAYGGLGKAETLATLIRYKENTTVKSSMIVRKKVLQPAKGIIGIAGAGNFTKMTLLPALKGSRAQIKYIVSSGGLNGTVLAKKYAIAQSTTDYDLIIQDDDVDLVMITTRHHLHATMVIAALEKGKHVFVEKPLALTTEELSAIDTAYQNSTGSLMVGFNRRFSPHTQKIKAIVGDRPMQIIATMNAGAVAADSWLQDMETGGGRIIGEACHYLDLIVYLTGSSIKAVCMNAMGKNPPENTDDASILLKMENGSTAVVNYFSNGAKAYPKERLEVFSQGKTLIMDNFIKTTAYGVKGFSKLKTRLDKGHKNQFRQIIKQLKKGDISLISYENLINVTRSSLAAIQSLKEGRWVDVD